MVPRVIKSCFVPICALSAAISEDDTEDPPPHHITYIGAAEAEPIGAEGYEVCGYTVCCEGVLGSFFGADWKVEVNSLAGKSFALLIAQTAIFANSHSDTKSNARNC